MVHCGKKKSSFVVLIFFNSNFSFSSDWMKDYGEMPNGTVILNHYKIKWRIMT